MDLKTLKQRIIFRRIIQILVIGAIFLMAITRINHENDLFWQLKMGEDIFKNHFFPISDPYNLSNPGAVWTLEEWLPSVSFYLIYTYIGAWGLIFYKAVIISLTFLLFMLLFNRMKINLYLSLIILLLAAMVNTRGIWGVFPSIFEYFFIALTILLLEKYRESKKTWIPIFLIPLSLFWVECHASFFLFTGMVGAYLFGDIFSEFISKHFSQYQPLGGFLDRKQRKWLLIVFLISFITPLIHPNGYWMWLYPFRITFGKFTSYVSEYQKFWDIWKWNFSDFIHGFTFILMMIMTGVFIFAWKKIHFKDVILAGIYSLLALTAVRHVAVFALISLFLITRYLTVWFGEYRGLFKRTILKDIVIIILIVCFIYFYKTQVVGFGFNLSEDGYPKEAAELVNQSGIPGNMFNHYNYGGYLIWKMAPKYKVFIDGRLEMYEGQAGVDYQIILGAQDGYQDLLEKYKINFFLLYISDPIIEKIYKDPNWKYIIHDSQYVLFVKNVSENQNFIKKNWAQNKEKEFQKIYELSINRYKAQNYNNQGIDFLSRKEYFAALESFSNAVMADPTFIEAKLNLAKMYTAIGSMEEAVGVYKSILEQEPGNKEAEQALSNLQRYLGK